MFDAAAECGRTLCAYQNRRCEAAFLAFRQALQDGILGDLRLLRRRVTTGRGPGNLLDFGSHVIDQVICLTGGRAPAEVSAVIQNPQAEYDGAAGFFKLVMRYPEGLMAEVEQTPHPTQVNYFYGAGTQGSFQQDWADNMADLFRKQMALNCPDNTWLPACFEELFPGIFCTIGSLYYLCYVKLYEHLAEGAPPPVSREDTLLQFAIIEAMFESARSNRTVALRAP